MTAFCKRYFSAHLCAFLWSGFEALSPCILTDHLSCLLTTKMWKCVGWPELHSLFLAKSFTHSLEILRREPQYQILKILVWVLNKNNIILYRADTRGGSGYCICYHTISQVNCPAVWILMEFFLIVCRMQWHQSFPFFSLPRFWTSKHVALIRMLSPGLSTPLLKYPFPFLFSR